MSIEHDFYFVIKDITPTGQVVYKKWSQNPVEKQYDNMLKPAFVRGRSCCVSDKIDEWFSYLDSENLGKDLLRDLRFEEDDLKFTQFNVIELNDLKKEQVQYIKSGYFLISDVNAYLDPDDDTYWIDDLFYDKLTPEAYAAKLANETGLSVNAIDAMHDNGEHLATEYMYFAYPDYCGLEYGLAFAKDVAELYEVDNMCLLHFIC